MKKTLAGAAMVGALVLMNVDGATGAGWLAWALAVVGLVVLAVVLPDVRGCNHERGK